MLQYLPEHGTRNTEHGTLIGDRTIMSVLSKNPLNLQQIAIAILFILTNLLFFQPSQAQLFDPYSGFTCDAGQGCKGWGKDSLRLYLPAPNQDCAYKFYFKFRFKDCDSNHLEIQPVGILLDYELQNCNASVGAFYGDTNNIHRIESLLRLADREMVFNHNLIMSLSWRIGDTNAYKGYFVYDTVSLIPLIVDSTLTSDSSLKTTFIRPTCRGICISYNRTDSNSAISSVYAKWYNCGNACCEIISSFCNVSSLTNIPSEYLNDGYSARINVEVNNTGECNTSPDTSCPSSSFNTRITRFKSCRDYCQDVDGLDPFGITHIENTKGVINIDEMPYFSDKLIKNLSNDKLLESTSDNLIINISEDILSVKIVSINGIELLKFKSQKGNEFLPISLHSLQNGLYLLVLETTKDGIVTKPIIISR